jgi:serine/threonine protein phosphatase 1
MKFFTWKRAPKPTFEAPLEPEVPFCAVGDIHGCDALLARMLERLRERMPPEARLVLVGDYIDRGEQSHEALLRIHALQQEAPEGAVTCLRGNHEQMLLDVLDRPARNGPRWLRYGGLQTLASFGLRGLPETASEAQWEDLRDRLRAALGPDLEMWLRALPTLWQSGNVAVVHAGADPALPLSAQSAEVLTWGHEAFERVPRRDGVWIVHGHTIVEEARPVLGRIPVDTGAYATGRLSCALVAPNQLEFLQA